MKRRVMPAPLPAERVYRRAHDSAAVDTPAPLVWAFDGPLDTCLADIEDTLRRALVMIGDVARVALLIELSLPALQQRVAAGDRVQPGWARFHERLAAYGLPTPPRVRPHTRPGPLATLVIAYRN